MRLILTWFIAIGLIVSPVQSYAWFAMIAGGGVASDTYVLLDDFSGTNGDPPNSSYWSSPTVSGGNSSMDIQSNALRVVIPSTDTAAGDAYARTDSYGLLELTGDYDVSIDWNIVSKTDPSGSYLCNWAMLTTYETGGYTSWVQIRRVNYAGSTDTLRVTGDGTNWIAAPSNVTTTATSGKFRTSRSGSTITFWYDIGSGWEWDGNSAGWSFTANTNDVWFRIYTGACQTSAITIDYDNFTVWSGTVN